MFFNSLGKSPSHFFFEKKNVLSKKTFSFFPKKVFPSPSPAQSEGAAIPIPKRQA
jgi:hypothetical protein